MGRIFDNVALWVLAGVLIALALFVLGGILKIIALVAFAGVVATALFMSHDG